jgi:hypothetical protein
MAGNKTVPCHGRGRAEIRTIDYQTCGLRGGPGVSIASARPQPPRLRLRVRRNCRRPNGNLVVAEWLIGGRLMTLRPRLENRKRHIT